MMFVIGEYEVKVGRTPKSQENAEKLCRRLENEKYMAGIREKAALDFMMMNR